MIHELFSEFQHSMNTTIQSIEDFRGKAFNYVSFKFFIDVFDQTQAAPSSAKFIECF